MPVKTNCTPLWPNLFPHFYGRDIFAKLIKMAENPHKENFLKFFVLLFDDVSMFNRKEFSIMLD